jgi:hypothetical protein
MEKNEKSVSEVLDQDVDVNLDSTTEELEETDTLKDDASDDDKDEPSDENKELPKDENKELPKDEPAQKPIDKNEVAFKEISEWLDSDQNIDKGMRLHTKYSKNHKRKQFLALNVTKRKQNLPVYLSEILGSLKPIKKSPTEVIEDKKKGSEKSEGDKDKNGSKKKNTGNQSKQNSKENSQK